MLERLKSILGEEGLRTGAAAAAWAVHGIFPKAVAAPASAEEAAAVLALASEEGWAVEPAGAGGGLDAGRPPERVELVLATERLAGLVAYEPADLVASVGAGMPLRTLQARLASEGQWLPLDPPGRGAATLGAIVSTASAGPLRQGHGTPRDHVLGLQVVTGDGRVLNLGGQVVKNVAGYDLVKLMVGSRGTLGLITRATVRLRPIPEQDATVLLTAREAAPLLEVVARIREARLEPVALELVSGPLQGGWSGTGWALLVRLQGNAEAVAAAESSLREIGDRGSLQASTPPAAAAGLWSVLGELEAGAGLSIRLADVPSRLEETLAQALRIPGMGTGSPVLAHAGVGIVRVLVPGPGAGLLPDAERLATALLDARAALGRRRGTLTIARAPEALLRRVAPYGEVGPALRIMQALKKEFDPAGVLAPGRFVA